MNWALWVYFTTVSTVNIVTPGPANLNTVRRTLQLGSKRVLPTIFGNALGLAVGGAISAAGIASFVLTSDILWALFRYLGILYLAWLGAKLLIKRERLVLDELNDYRLAPVGFWEWFSMYLSTTSSVMAPAVAQK